MLAEVVQTAMTFKSIVGHISLAACLLAGLVSAPLAESARAQAGRATKRALKRGTPARRDAGQGIVRQSPRSRTRPVAKQARRNAGRGMVERLMRMPAPRRRRFLHDNPRFQRLPLTQRQNIQRRLQEFDRMRPAQRELLLQRYELFGQLTPQQQQQARGVHQRWRQVPAGRRKELMTEFQQLRQASADARLERFAAAEFEEQYSQSEQQLLKDITGLLPPSPEDEKPPR